MTVVETAEILINKGLSIIPVGNDKRPLIKWSSYQKVLPDFFLLREHYIKADGLALVCGEISGNAEAIDFDEKVVISGSIFEEWIDLVEEIDKEILYKCVIQTTKNKGFHVVYKCDEIAGNQRFARRPTSEAERETSPNEKYKTMIESRGEGGYILIAPSPGYELQSGHFAQIGTITPDERAILIDCAIRLNQFTEKHEPQGYKKQIKSDKKSAFKDYNEAADAVEILEKNDWSVVHSDGSKVYLKRPGESSSKWSAEWDGSIRQLYVFTTSSVFSPEESYDAAAIFTILECSGDYATAYKKLRMMGYGEDYEAGDAVDNQSIDKIIKDSTLTEGGINRVTDMILKDGFKKGLDTGMAILDKHFRFKENNFIIVTAHTNVGKTFLTLYLTVLSAYRHKQKWLLYCVEDSVDIIIHHLIGFYLADSVKDIARDHPDQLIKAKKFVKDHYVIISPETMLEIDDVLLIGERLHSSGKINNIMIDPLSSVPGYSMDLDFHNKISLKLLNYTRAVCSIYMTTHTATTMARTNDPPSLYSIQYGSLWVAKVDFHLSYHRYMQDQDKFTITEFAVNKVRSILTGGLHTFKDNPLKFHYKGNYNWHVEGFIDGSYKRESNPMSLEDQKMEELDNLEIDF